MNFICLLDGTLIQLLILKYGTKIIIFFFFLEFKVLYFCYNFFKLSLLPPPPIRSSTSIADRKRANADGTITLFSWLRLRNRNAVWRGECIPVYSRPQTIVIKLYTRILHTALVSYSTRCPIGSDVLFSQYLRKTIETSFNRRKNARAHRDYASTTMPFYRCRDAVQKEICRSGMWRHAPFAIRAHSFDQLLLNRKRRAQLSTPH